MKSTTSTNFSAPEKRLPPTPSKQEFKQTPKDPRESFLPLISIKPESLPSRGFFYPEDVSLSYRPFMYGEVKKANQSKFSVKQGMEFMLQGVTVEGMDPLDLTLSDALYLGMLRKISTIKTPKFILPWRCPNCNHNNRFIGELSILEFHDLESDDSVEVEMDDNSILEFAPLTVKRFFDLHDHTLQNDDIALFAAQCTTLPFEEAYKRFTTCSVEEGVLLEEADRLLFHGVKNVSDKCTNPECNHPISLSLDGGETLFLPFRESENNVKDRVRLSSKSKSKS